MAKFYKVATQVPLIFMAFYGPVVAAEQVNATLQTKCSCEDSKIDCSFVLTASRTRYGTRLTGNLSKLGDNVCSTLAENTNNFSGEAFNLPTSILNQDTISLGAIADRSIDKACSDTSGDNTHYECSLHLSLSLGDLKVAENFYRGTKSWYVTGGLDFDKRVIDEEDDNKEVLDDISQKLRKIRTNFHVLMRHNVISLHEISGSKSVTLKKLP